MSGAEAGRAQVVPCPETGKEPLPPGYKRTEVGVIPEDWEVKPLGSVVARLISGVSVNSVADDVATISDEAAVLKTSCVQSGAFFPSESKVIAGKDRCRAKLNPKQNTILISRMNTIDLVGECGFVDRDYPNLFIPDRLWLTDLHDDSLVSTRWLSRVLSSLSYRKRLQAVATGTSGSMKNIAQMSFLSLPVAFPPLCEQRAIAEALSDVDGLIDALDKLIAKKQAIKRAAMEELLTGKTRLPGFCGKWEAKRLGDVIEKLVGGGTPSRGNPAFWGNEIPWVTVKDFTTFHPRQTQESITKVGLNNSASHLIPAGTLITSTRMALGKAVVYEVDVAINQDLKALFLKLTASIRFLYYWFEHNGLMIDDIGSGSTVKGISIKELRSIPFPHLSLPEQTAIAAVLSDMDAEIFALEARREKTQAIKKGMMEQLLTGKVRLV